MTGPSLKQRLLALLKKQHFDEGLHTIRAMRPRRVISHLIAFLCAADEAVKWRSVLAIGAVVADLAETDGESARVIMRRLMWHLNDESGGIGWGVPEAMGEIMARSPKLADEYAFILVSYLQPDGNYIEYPMLQRGVLWGFGRLAHARPELLAHAACLLRPYLESQDPAIRGLAAYAAGALPRTPTERILQKLVRDRTEFTMVENGLRIERTVGQAAASGLGNIDAVPPQTESCKVLDGKNRKRNGVADFYREFRETGGDRY